LLKALVIGMGVLIVAGTVTLVALIVQRSGGDSAMPPRSLGQPAGTRLVSVAAMEGRLAVLVARPDGLERVLLVDPRSGRVLGEFRAAD
jgi:hypothetical protein